MFVEPQQLGLFDNLEHESTRIAVVKTFCSCNGQLTLGCCRRTERLRLKFKIPGASREGCQIRW